MIVYLTQATERVFSIRSLARVVLGGFGMVRRFFLWLFSLARDEAGTQAGYWLLGKTVLGGVTLVGLTAMIGSLLNAPIDGRIAVTTFVFGFTLLIALYLLQNFRRNRPNVSPAVHKVSHENQDHEREHVTRIKYSGTQVLTCTNEPFGEGTDTINLDNVGTLIQRGPSDHNVVELVVPNAAELEVDEPKADAKYAVGHGQHVEFPGAAVEGIEIRGAKMTSVSHTYRFDRFVNRSYLIPAGGRTFMVTLVAIRDKSGLSLQTGKERWLMEYEFQISEK